MDVLYATSDYYAPITGISILSLFENNQDIDEIRIFLVDNGISDENKGKIIGLTNHYKREILFIEPKLDTKNAGLDGISARHKQWLAYWGMSYLHLLPQNVGCLLYLDSDIIITSSLKELSEIGLHDNIIAGVPSPYQNKLATYMNYPDGYHSINLGVLYINVPEFKRNNIYITFCRLLSELYKSEYGSIASIADGVWTLAIKNSVYILPAQYNFCPEAAIAPYKNEKYIDFVLLDMGIPEENLLEYKNAYKNPIIIHYTGAPWCGRPWEKGCIHPFRCYFDKFKSISPWKDMPLFPSTRTKLTKTLFILKKVLPYPIFFWLKFKVLRGAGKRMPRLRKLILDKLGS
jgi:lipopolysaccharide biosynthesis glycosyltransferase